MKVLEILNYVLLLSLFTCISSANSDEQSDYSTVKSGFSFSSKESVNGIGFTSTRSCINVAPEILHSRSSGSGSYRYDSDMQLINFTASDPGNGFSTAGRSIELQENTSFTYTPILLANEGTFRSGQVKSLWDDSIATGNGGGAYMKVGFDNTRVLSKDIHTKVSGFDRIENILSSSGKFDAGMKLSAAFTGNERLVVSLKETNNTTPTRLMEEYYSGTFRMTKNLGLTVYGSKLDYGDTSEADNAINWLPCACFAGYDDMDLHDKRCHSAEGFFDVSACQQSKPCSNKLG
jgi:hypothetical protein